jgi:hypothetical protein
MLPWSSYLTHYAAARPVQARVSWVEMVVAMGVWKYTGAVAGECRRVGAQTALATSGRPPRQ